jgi:phage terminase large subunit
MGYPIVAVFDIGISDATAIWTVQYVEDKILFLDYYENTNEPMPHYISYLDDNGFKYNKIVVPHDSRHRWWGSGKTIYEVVAQEAKKRRWNIVDLAPYSIADGINKAKTVFPNCHFNKERCRSIKELQV